MRKTFSILLLSCFAVTMAYAQQNPVTTRPLTPSEQRQKEKLEREIQRERQIRAEWLQKQREYEAKKAEKERRKQAKKEGRKLDEVDAPKVAPAPVTPTTTPASATSVPSTTLPTTPAPVTPTPTPVTPAPTRSEPSTTLPATPAPVTPAPMEPAKTTPVTTQPVEAPAATTPKESTLGTERKERRKKETKTEKKPTTEVKPTNVSPEAAHPETVETAPESVETTPKKVNEPVKPETVAKPEKTARPERERKRKEEKIVVVDAHEATSANPEMSQPRREFLPKGHLFEPILLDPLEAQTYGSVLPSYWTEGKKYAGSIVPFAFGFAKPFYRRTTSPGRAEEWVLDLASFTQFEAYYDAQAGKAKRQIMNNDYKISIIYNIRRGDNNYRIRVYHLSSHLGDDYIYRNQITAPSPNSVNYEQLDFTYSRTVNNLRLYGGAGVVLRKTNERKPLSMQLGAFYKKPSDKAVRLVGGLDVKFWQQTNFRPGIHGGIGIELGRTQNNLTFLVEGYSGFKPYSQYEDQQTSWMGIGVYLNPF